MSSGRTAASEESTVSCFRILSLLASHSSLVERDCEVEVVVVAETELHSSDFLEGLPLFFFKPAKNITYE